MVDWVGVPPSRDSGLSYATSVGTGTFDTCPVAATTILQA